MQMKKNKRPISEQTVSLLYPWNLMGPFTFVSLEYPWPLFKYTQTDECTDNQNDPTKNNMKGMKNEK